MNHIYRTLGTTRQNIHQRLKRDLDHMEEACQLVRIVDQYREDHPKMGAKPLYKKIQPATMGRDRFLEWYRDQGYTVRPKKNFRRTTDSSGVIRFPNLTEGIELTGVNQLWVSDITYYEMDKKFFYLTFIMDQFSRKIKGYSASRSLKTIETTIPALKMALKELRAGEKPIIHSDGGGQYYSRAFLDLTRGRLINSMGKTAYENPYAERLNRTIKECYLDGYKPNSFPGLTQSLRRSTRMYNQEKPHQGIKGDTPTHFEENWRMKSQLMFNHT